MTLKQLYKYLLVCYRRKEWFYALKMINLTLTRCKKKMERQVMVEEGFAPNKSRSRRRRGPTGSVCRAVAAQAVAQKPLSASALGVLRSGARPVRSISALDASFSEKWTPSVYRSSDRCIALRARSRDSVIGTSSRS